MKKHIIFFMSIMLISGAIFAQSLTSAKGVRVISQNGGDKSLTGVLLVHHLHMYQGLHKHSILSSNLQVLMQNLLMVFQ